MVRVHKNFGDIPEGLLKPGSHRILKDAIDKKSGGGFKAHHYAPDDVRALLSHIYKEKCAYCESLTAHVASLQVEHYRPKAKVEDKTPSYSGPGYYWLALEWSNLLLACPKCNGKGAKANQFPVLGTRVVEPPVDAKGELVTLQCRADLSPLVDEDALLIHPEIDEPADHLTVLANGEMAPENGSLKGGATIRICDLNRAALVRERAKVIKQLVYNLQTVVVFINSHPEISAESAQHLLNLVFDSLIELTHPEQPYLLLAQRIHQDFDGMVLSHFPDQIRSFLHTAYHHYRQSAGPLPPQSSAA
jgi:uncharacterized protein (TIGR02646 family)